MYAALLKDKFQRLTFDKCDFAPLQQTPKEIVHLIAKQNTALQLHNWNDPVDAGALQLLFAAYLNEIWISEFPPEKSFNSIEIIELLLLQFDESKNEPDDLVEKLKSYQVKDAVRLACKLRNLLQATRRLFGVNFRTFSSDAFSVKLATDLHAIIGARVIENAGQFRSKIVQAINSNVMYCLPGKIEARMATLFEFVTERRDSYISLNVEDRTEKMILLGAFFFSEFLLIHPFSNGNGRTARLLLNFLLKDICAVPFSLYYRNRGLYIRVLEERNPPYSLPTSLAMYVLLCIERCCSDLVYLIMS